jgi:hypothetical protein
MVYQDTTRIATILPVNFSIFLAASQADVAVASLTLHLVCTHL